MTTSLNGTVLATGGAGYTGSHTVRPLRAAGRDVVSARSLAQSWPPVPTPNLRLILRPKMGLRLVVLARQLRVDLLVGSDDLRIICGDCGTI